MNKVHLVQPALQVPWVNQVQVSLVFQALKVKKVPKVQPELKAIKVKTATEVNKVKPANEVLQVTWAP